MKQSCAPEGGRYEFGVFTGVGGGTMNALFSGNKNPLFATFTEYAESALLASGAETFFFDNRDFIVPGRASAMFPFLKEWDIQRLNSRLLAKAKALHPDLFLETGGFRILPETVDAIGKIGIKTVLWTTDAPINFEPVLRAASRYEHIFTAGSEAYDILKSRGVDHCRFLPFACDPREHRPVKLTETERTLYACDIAFVGSVHPDLYPLRVKTLEALTDYNLGIWGPGAERLPFSSPLRPFVRGGETPPEIWTKIYAAARIVLCMHYKDPRGIIPCHQASPRVYEAMACGSFLMVDNQRDVRRLFQDGEELVIFDDAVDLRKRAAYYLGRPDERAAIAARGRQTVLERHTYKNRIEEMLQAIGLDPKEPPGR